MLVWNLMYLPSSLSLLPASKCEHVEAEWRSRAPVGLCFWEIPSTATVCADADVKGECGSRNRHDTARHGLLGKEGLYDFCLRGAVCLDLTSDAVCLFRQVFWSPAGSPIPREGYRQTCGGRSSASSLAFLYFKVDFFASSGGNIFKVFGYFVFPLPNSCKFQSD